MADGNGANGHGRRILWDPTIRLGDALTAAAMLIAVVVSWVTMDARVSRNADDIKRVEGQAAKETKSVETVLADKINAERARLDQTQLRTGEDIREIKGIIRDGFRDLDMKLDKKADKPGR